MDRDSVRGLEGLHVVCGQHYVREVVVHRPVAGAGIDRDRRQVPRNEPGFLPGEQGAAAARPAVVRRRIHRVAPGDHVAAAIEGAVHGVGHRWTERLPSMLVPSHPLQAHGFADELGHQCGIRGRVVRTIVAIAARALDVDDPDRGERNPEDIGNGLPQRVYALRARPDRRLDPIGIGSGGDVRHGA